MPGGGFEDLILFESGPIGLPVKQIGLICFIPDLAVLCHDFWGIPVWLLGYRTHDMEVRFMSVAVGVWLIVSAIAVSSGALSLIP